VKTDPMTAPPKLHRHSVSGGIAWLTSQSILRQIISFGLFVVLGRLLTPVDFGTVGLCASIIMILQSIASYGVSSAVVQKSELSDDEASVAYTINWLIAGSISAAILATAIALGCFWFRGDSFPYVLGVLALSPLLSAAYEIQQARMLRLFRFDIAAKKALVAQVAGGLVAISSAFAGAGVWSLVLQQYTILAVELVVVLRASPWRPHFRLEKSFVLHLSGFGSHLMGARFLGTIETRIVDIIIGAFIDQASIGFYRVARNMFDVTTSVFATPIQSVALPYFSAKQIDVQLVKGAFLEMTEALAWLILPPFLTLAVWAPIFITTVFGAKWTASGWILQILSLQVVVYASFMLYDPLLIGIGSTKQAFRLRCWQTGISLTLCLASAHFGLVALVSAQVLSLYVAAPIMFAYIGRALDLRLETFLIRQLKPHFFALLFVAAAYGLDRCFFQQQDLPGLLAALALSYMCYGLAFLLTASDVLRARAISLLRLS
jgi:O-antigen/teichoic acid export membrane protein